MSDTAIRIIGIVTLVACIEFIACAWMYDHAEKQRKRADYWRAIAKEQSAPSYVEIKAPIKGEYTPEPGDIW